MVVLEGCRFHSYYENMVVGFLSESGFTGLENLQDKVLVNVIVKGSVIVTVTVLVNVIVKGSCFARFKLPVVRIADYADDAEAVSRVFSLNQDFQDKTVNMCSIQSMC